MSILTVDNPFNNTAIKVKYNYLNCNTELFLVEKHCCPTNLTIIRKYIQYIQFDYLKKLGANAPFVVTLYLPQSKTTT